MISPPGANRLLQRQHHPPVIADIFAAPRRPFDEPLQPDRQALETPGLLENAHPLTLSISKNTSGSRLAAGFIPAAVHVLAIIKRRDEGLDIQQRGAIQHVHPPDIE